MHIRKGTIWKRGQERGEESVRGERKASPHLYPSQEPLGNSRGPSSVFRGELALSSPVRLPSQ